MAIVHAIQSFVAAPRGRKYALWFVCFVYLALSAVMASANLDIDEFTFIREPYELLGGDYTTGYVREHNYTAAFKTLVSSYYFYWKYRPLISPIVSRSDKELFQSQEAHFGYVKPGSVSKADRDAEKKYSQRLIVPEPDRFYTHGAGKPLLPAILSIPQLALVKVVTPSNRNLLYYQYNNNYHPIFILVRLAQILAGLATVLLTYQILKREYDWTTAWFGAAFVAFLPVSIKYFPNLHHDSILAPFSLASLYLFYKKRYKSSGVLFGLALASKNVAILLVPTFIAFIIANALRASRDSAAGNERYSLSREAAGLATILMLGVVVLVPFANPISYAQEILTPVTHRERDLRGEDVEQFTLTTRLSGDQSSAGDSRSSAPGRQSPARGGTRAAPGDVSDTVFSAPRPGIVFSNMVFRLGSIDFFFLVIACVLFWSTPRDQLSKLCFILLLCALPYGLVFGYGLTYRSLLFVPVFAIACVTLAPQKVRLGLVMAFLSLALLYCIDPIRTDSIHVPVNDETLLGVIEKSI